MKIARKIGLVMLAVFILIQFLRPARNKGGQDLPTNITHVVAIPQEVKAVLRKACYNCHSNNTNYPWYINVQPIAWFMSNHVEEGKQELNFSAFESYSRRKQAGKFKSIASQVKQGEMPLSSYTLMHPEARLNSGEKRRIISRADSLASKD